MYLEKHIYMISGYSTCALDAEKCCKCSTNAIGKTISSAFSVEISGCLMQVSKYGFLWFSYRTVIFFQEMLGRNEGGYLQWLKLNVRDLILLLLKNVVESAVWFRSLNRLPAQVWTTYVCKCVAELCFYVADDTHSHTNMQGSWKCYFNLPEYCNTSY